MVGHSTKRENSSAPSQGVLRQPILGNQFLFEVIDLATEVTPTAKLQKNSTCENKTEGAQRRSSTKRALFSDQLSELDDEITSLI